MKRLILLLFCLALHVRARGQEQRLTLEKAVAMALANNDELIVERESVAIAKSAETRANAAYEPALHSDLRLRSHSDPVNSILADSPDQRGVQTSTSIVKLLPSGATVSMFSSFEHGTTNSIFANLTPYSYASLGAELRQPLLQNRRIDPARRAIRLAHADRSNSDAKLRRVIADTTAATERAYWNLVAARSAVGVRESAVKIAEAQRDDTNVRIKAGTQATSDLAQTNAEVEKRRAELITAIETQTRAENALKSVIAGNANDELWTQTIITSATEQPSNRATIETTTAIQQALNHRPELEELQARLAHNDIDIEANADRVRPQLDLIASYTERRLDGTLNDDAITPPFGIERSNDHRFPDASIGFSLTLPIGNTAAKQDVVIARAQRRQTATTIEQAKQQIAVEVRNAIASITSASQRIDATKAAREAAEIQLQSERDRFEAGASNNFFVLTRQNDLAAAQLAEIVALTDYQKARSELARATGGSL